ncbi:glutathione S-transferase [Roseovarius salis]|uniref:glutathione S-transferase n=1 Tax=Roseovarius salis TaxID=3376063 RepID=UPI0037C97529
MADYTLYYWPLPFRGQFVRAVLAHAGASWDEPAMDDVIEMKDRPVADQPVPFMAPPMLVDHDAGVSIAQLPAVLAYLGGKFALMPDDPGKAALTHKVVSDANDVLDEITRFGGRSMWTPGEWDTFAGERLPRWMDIFEATGRAHGLTPQGGYLLGSDAPGLADLVTSTLWVTIAQKLPGLDRMLEDRAPATAALARRIADLPALAAMRDDTDTRFGHAWCGGLIEASIREMLDDR